jgi:hypothetical protein
MKLTEPASRLSEVFCPNSRPGNFSSSLGNRGCMVSSLFGMAGLAEAALFLALLIGLGGLLLLAVAALVGWCWRSPVAAMIAIFLALVLGLLLRPWEAFRSIESDDADVHDWVSTHRVVAVLWTLGFAGAIASAIRALRSHSAGLQQEEGQSKPGRY